MCLRVFLHTISLSRLPNFVGTVGTCNTVYFLIVKTQNYQCKSSTLVVMVYREKLNSEKWYSNNNRSVYIVSQCMQCHAFQQQKYSQFVFMILKSNNKTNMLNCRHNTLSKCVVKFVQKKRNILYVEQPQSNRYPFIYLCLVSDPCSAYNSRTSNSEWLVIQMSLERIECLYISEEVENAK